MTDQAGLSATPPTHLNRGLFSDYYLDHLVPDSPEWKSENHLYAQAKALRDDLRALLLTIRPDSLDETQLEDRWIQPVLEKLGHAFFRQVKIRYRDSHRKPDYIFTATADEAAAFTNDIYEPQQIAHALAVGDAKKWGVNLDQASGRERLAPAAQIDEYLRYSELPWGILTDGHIWRLYHRDSSKNNDYYAVDLPALLTADHAVENFYYFYLFFRREAFTGWLERVRQGSVDYAEGLSDTLENEVYEALREIAQGFLNYRRNRLKPEAATLRDIYEQSLVLLYRLLFIHYAESRDVLPMSSNTTYAAQGSLRFINWQARRLLEDDKAYRLRADEGTLYERLRSLFLYIDSGSELYGIAPYNGRLFSEDEHPFLVEKFSGDAFLAPALDRLARVDAAVRREGQPRRVNVDYRDLDVRHLGAIYEKLLEYELDYSETGFSDKYGTVEPNSVYLRTGNNERKITGSYYTPDYIVRFIVERTLEPLLTDLTRQHATLDGDGHWLVRDADALRQAVLAINVLDPATGSGHFMVEAVAYIAEWLRRLGLRPADMAADEDELVYWKRQVVTSCIYGVDVNPLAVELAKLSLWLATIARGKPLSFLDHHVKLGNTLVGARIIDIPTPNPSPLRKEGLQNESVHTMGSGDGDIAQLPLFAETVGSAVQRMSAIEHTMAAVVADVKGQEHEYDVMQAGLGPWRALANVWTARHFGLPVTPEQWEAVSAWFVHPHPPAPSPLRREGEEMPQGVAEVLDEAERLAAQHRFFHWELAFPEVFFAPDGRPLADGGFDAVIGNPPYVRQQSISEVKPYLSANYAIWHNSADLFLYFYERALNLVKPSLRVGFITSGTYMNSSGAANFRRYIHENVGFESVVNFGENQPFKGAEMVYPTIAIIKRDRPSSTFSSLFVEDVYRRDQLGEAIKTLPMVETLSDVTGLGEWRFQSAELTELFRKITQGYMTLDGAVGGRLFYGVLTGLNDAFMIDGKMRRQLIEESQSSAEIIRHVLRGQDLRPWHQLDNDLYLIIARQGIEIDKYPAIKRHLNQFREKLEVKPVDWDERKQGKWQGRTAGNYQWCEWHDTVAYYQEFEKAKITWSDISKLPRFSMDDGSYIANTGFVIGDDRFSLLALLQSRALWFAISQIATPLRLRAGLWQYRLILQYVQRLPIPDLTAAQESGLAEVAEQITALARERYRLDEGMRHRVGDDLGQGGRLNNALEAWWELDFPAFHEQVKRAFKAEIPLKARDEWEAYLGDQRGRHDGLTAQIVAHETRLNAIVYAAFRLTAEETALIEQATKYPYGAV